MSARGLLIVGAGGHGRVIADTARAARLNVVAFADSGRVGQEVLGLPCWPGAPEVIAEAARREQCAVVVAVGDNRARATLQQQLVALDVELATIVHPSACVSPLAKVGRGSMVLACVVVAVGAEIGEGVILNHGVSVDHDGRVGDFAHLSPGVHTGGQVEIGEGSHLAVGVSVRNRVAIGSWSIVGVGAAVVADVPSNVVALGVPARVVRGNSPVAGEEK